VYKIVLEWRALYCRLLQWQARGSNPRLQRDLCRNGLPLRPGRHSACIHWFRLYIRSISCNNESFGLSRITPSPPPFHGHKIYVKLTYALVGTGRFNTFQAILDVKKKSKNISERVLSYHVSSFSSKLVFTYVWNLKIRLRREFFWNKS
jgi:hypothetical protein